MDLLSIGWTVLSAAPELAIGIAIGAYGYRYLLKKNPTALNALVSEVNASVTAIENEVSSVTQTVTTQTTKTGAAPVAPVATQTPATGTVPSAPTTPATDAK